ncbi:NAD-dependent succinate-semialdehyde dehydrogenase [Rhodococcus fascians]|nr:NAD-dependent succinate-semialdehyde dehydrogenase [Rhodococcus fascians]MBY4239448.1 NAD-dependent succinate-semialdehyde dehydrogenase [Rhodococcus fascians]MBY4254969.1 NAD-dependent succinate-semialdehyde dehydrogenase [Rhodococcus fascians]MBY4270804.1 NAD-dependent succinate-semialdehyde dehydrogenase [Rhodococcus fascians]
MTDLEKELLDSVPNELFIGGRWRAASSNATLSVHDPATGDAIRDIADASPEDGMAALDAAVAAADAWAATPARERAEILRRAFDLLQSRKEDFALLMTIEMGKPLAEARGEVAYGGEFLRWFSEEATRVQGRYGANPENTGRMFVTQHPVGPCFLITPWNFPLAMATRKIAPALAAGCTVVVKPAALTPLTTLLLAKILQDAGLPDGVVNVVTTTSSSAVSEPIIADPRLRKLSFTGSTPVGQALLRQAATGVLRTSMELGGNAPFVVFGDADLDKAVDGAIAAKFRNIGQACTAANRFIVHSSVATEFGRRVTERVAAFGVGRGTEDGVTIGPLIDNKAVAKARELVDDAVKRGAAITTGGAALDRPGTFFAPTVLTDVAPGSDILREEIFGPVLAISTFDTDEEAVSSANDTEYGLVSYVYTEDFRRGQRMIERLQTGMMGLNVGVVSNAAAPFGGWKMSGLGREGGSEGIHEYLQTKYTLTPPPFA